MNVIAYPVLLVARRQTAQSQYSNDAAWQQETSSYHR
ncbi:MAG: hypothetical protein KatS3mg056_1266 [Chloroflexus sp.]|nr:MAG: hypothetical protein KatS3mg056_1266 [Chloroflexus sp.]